MLNLDKITSYLENIQQTAESREKENLLFLRDLPASKRVFIIDSREPNPYYFQNSVKKCLSEGDYTIDKFEGVIVVERKEKNDFISSLIHNKERFHNELERLKPYEQKCIVAECLYSDILKGNYTSKAHPNSIEGLSHSISYNYCPVFFVESFELGNRFSQLYLSTFARKKENNYSFPMAKRPMELRLDQTVLNYRLDEFIKEITVNKIDFKFFINQLKSYPSSAIVLQCKYSNIVENTSIESIVFSLIVDHGINVYFMENQNIANRFIDKHLQRYRPIKEKKKRDTKKGSSLFEEIK